MGTLRDAMKGAYSVAATKVRSFGARLQSSAEESELQRSRAALSRGKKIAFFHLPKTAGTTMHSVLASQYSYSQIYHLDHVPCVNERKHILDAATKPDIYFMSGHFFVEELCNQGSVVTVTLVRDPIERLKSLYRWWLSYDIDATSSERERYLVGQAKTNGPLEFFKIDEVQYLYSEIREFYGGSAYGEAYDDEVVLRNLNSINFVGLTEHMGEFCNFLAHSVGLPYVSNIPTFNKTDKRHTFPSALDDFLAERLQGEYGVYAHCEKLYKSYRRRSVKAMYMARLDGVREHHCYDNNWYPWESIDGREYRWSFRGEAATIYLYIGEDEEVNVNIEVCDFLQGERPTIEWEYGIAQGGAHWDGNTATISLHSLDNHDLAEIRVSKNTKEVGYKDSRDLGVPIWRPTITRRKK